MELFVCPEHFIIYIPGILLETTECIKNTNLNNETELKIKTLLTKINQCITKLELINDENNNSDTINKNIKTIKWILQGTMINYNFIFKETATFYNKVSGSYTLLNNNSENKNIIIATENKNYNNNLITLETIIIIENNIEHCDTILNLLQLINNNDYEILFQKENNYIICLISKLIEIIRMYKIEMYKMIVN